ncbi:phosphonate transport system ATP-binding protein [Paenibacillus shirakamiensis]|uniref:Phosphonate transport system ATP-binding protein n=1 Tax=Paenibacillus shirakamiensis TaxID=1265935 RepID=A0ABS4JDQ6_9BACL|nr:ATP-binding cassette domain-containing protein [Paenibacillus shirakamiensis]MBP1999828.1 phosphonate transport system ATP-binding protein [Paenibacillus shirakamiensis]
MLTVNQMQKTIGSDPKKVLDGWNVHIHEGDMIGVVGPSGSGKSTLLRCLALRDSWTNGNFTLGGDVIIDGGGKGKRKFRSQFAYLEQNPELYPQKSALKNVLIGQAGQTDQFRRMIGMVRSDDYMGAMDELEKFGLLDKAHVKAAHLSGGEKQRVAICRALVHGANFIAVDEPVIGLDKFSAEKVLSTLRDLCKEQKKTVIAVLPLEYAEKYCTRLWGIYEGRLQWDVSGRRLTAEEKQFL